MTDHPLDDAIRRLVEIRSALGWSQLIAEERIGCSAGLLPKYESGSRKPSLPGLIMWASALDCDVVLNSSAIMDGGQVANDLRSALELLRQAGVQVIVKPRPVGVLDGGNVAAQSLRRTAQAAERLIDLMVEVQNRLSPEPKP